MSTTVPFLGIDFGTSMSKMAWYNPKSKEAKILSNYEGDTQTPSVVYLGKDETKVGDDALTMLEYEKERDRVILSIKRELVTTPIITVPGRSARAVEAAAAILGKLKGDAEKLHFHQEVTRAVVTCPASFDHVEHKAIREAAHLAGFKEVELLEEPVAAALAYTRLGLAVSTYVLIYDLGGGTFDLAVLARDEDSSFRPALEPQGIKRCGGDDFDEELYQYCNKIAVERLGRPISTEGKRDLAFLEECRKRKENLSTTERRLFKSYLEPDATLFQQEIDRVTFEHLIQPKIEETVRRTRALLEQARAEEYDVDMVVLIGGSTRVPLVGRLLSEHLPTKLLEWEGRDSAVALGAAYYANHLWGAESQYRHAVEMAWADQQLEEAEVAQLKTLAQELGLSEEQSATMEHQVMGADKKTVLAHQTLLAHYRHAVREAWVDKKLDEGKIDLLVTLANRSTLGEDEIAAIECEVVGEINEAVLAHHRNLEHYRSAVQEAWQDKKLERKEIAYLYSLAQQLQLSEEEVNTIEHEVQAPATIEHEVQTPAQIIVSPLLGEGQYTTISEALRQAQPGVLIKVRPGVYREGLVLERPMELVGDGPAGAIIIEAADMPCLLMQTDEATVSGVTLRSRVGQSGKEFFTVDIPQGRLVLKQCDITSDGMSCLAIHGSSANPLIQECQIHDGKQAGLYVYENGQGVIEDCNIFGNACSGVEIKQGGNPTIRRSRIHDGKSCGLIVYENGQGVIEDCDIFGNAYSGVEIRQGGNPTIRRSRIHDGKWDGIYVHGFGGGTIEGCTAVRNAGRDWHIGFWSNVRRL